MTWRPSLQWLDRLAIVRKNGPRRHTLRHMLEWLVSQDSNPGQWVYAGTMHDDTRLSERCIRDGLRDLVLLGWLVPEIEAGTDDRTIGRTHGHMGGCRIGGKGCCTRYRIVYLATRADEPAPRRKVKRGHGAPQEPGTGRRESDPETSPADPTSRQGAPETGQGAPNKGAPRAPDPLHTIHKGSVIGGDTPPTPPGDEVAVWGAALRREMQQALLGAGAYLADPADRIGWEGLAIDWQLEPREVAAAVHSLARAWEAANGLKPRRPYHFRPFVPFLDPCRASLARRREFDAQSKHLRIHKETA